jgi:hypothetical protein
MQETAIMKRISYEIRGIDGSRMSQDLETDGSKRNKILCSTGKI